MEHQTVDDANLADKLAASIEYADESMDDIETDDDDTENLEPIADEDMPFWSLRAPTGSFFWEGTL